MAADARDGVGGVIATLGLSLSVLAALVAWMPLVGVYGLAGLLGVGVCVLSLIIAPRRAWPRAVPGVLVGTCAAAGGWFWWNSLTHLNGHPF